MKDNRFFICNRGQVQIDDIFLLCFFSQAVDQGLKGLGIGHVTVCGIIIISICGADGQLHPQFNGIPVFHREGPQNPDRTIAVSEVVDEACQSSFFIKVHWHRFRADDR